MEVLTFNSVFDFYAEYQQRKTAGHDLQAYEDPFWLLLGWPDATVQERGQVTLTQVRCFPTEQKKDWGSLGTTYTDFRESIRWTDGRGQLFGTPSLFFLRGEAVTREEMDKRMACSKENLFQFMKAALGAPSPQGDLTP